MSFSHSKTMTNNNIRRVPEPDRMRVLGALGSLSSINPEYSGNAMPLSTSYMNNYTHGNNVAPPPLPPRMDVSRYNRYSNFNSYYSPYSRCSPGMYSPYGGYRTPYNRYGMPPQDSYNSFIQLAEESTRPAFESIESVVDIVGSISMMLESTYHAVYSSYNAILGVVDQFSRLKDHLAEVLSFLALLRGLKYICLKILYLLKLRKKNPSVEAAWNTARSVTENTDIIFHDKKSPWPFFMFVGLVIGAPWLMFKLLAKSVANKPFDINSWRERNGKFRICIAQYDFDSRRRGELSFHAGDVLYMAPNQHQANAPKGWLLACNKSKKVGLIPQNYMKMNHTPLMKRNPVQRPMNDIPDSSFENLQENTSPKEIVDDNVPSSDSIAPLDPSVEFVNTDSE